MDVDEEGTHENLGGGGICGNVLYHHVLGGSYMVVYSHQNSSI